MMLDDFVTDTGGGLDDLLPAPPPDSDSKSASTRAPARTQKKAAARPPASTRSATPTATPAGPSKKTTAKKQTPARPSASAPPTARPKTTESTVPAIATKTRKKPTSKVPSKTESAPIKTSPPAAPVSHGDVSGTTPAPKVSANRPVGDVAMLSIRITPEMSQALALWSLHQLESGAQLTRVGLVDAAVRSWDDSLTDELVAWAVDEPIVGASSERIVTRVPSDQHHRLKVALARIQVETGYKISLQAMITWLLRRIIVDEQAD